MKLDNFRKVIHPIKKESGTIFVYYISEEDIVDAEFIIVEENKCKALIVYEPKEK